MLRNRQVDGAAEISNERDVIADASHFSEADVEQLDQIVGLRGWRIGLRGRRIGLRGRRISLLRERGWCCADADDAEEDDDPAHTIG